MRDGVDIGPIMQLRRMLPGYHGSGMTTLGTVTVDKSDADLVAYLESLMSTMLIDRIDLRTTAYGQNISDYRKWLLSFFAASSFYKEANVSALKVLNANGALHYFFSYRAMNVNNRIIYVVVEGDYSSVVSRYATGFNQMNLIHYLPSA